MGFFGFLLDWIITRDWWRASWLLVAIVPLISLVGLSVWGSSLNQNDMAARYLVVGERELNQSTNDWIFEGIGIASKDKDVEGEDASISRYTETLFRRARQLQPENPRTAFIIAALLSQQGATAQAMSIMQNLAPDSRDGYPPAHAWLASLMLSTKQVRGPNLLKLKHHVLLGVTWEDAPAFLLVEATKFAVRERQSDRALDLLSNSAEKEPAFEAELFRLAISLENYRVAEQTAEKALPRLLDLIEKGEATAADRIALADILFFQEDYGAAESALRGGIEDAALGQQDHEQLARALSEMYRLRYTRTLEVSNDSWAADLTLLDQAMRADPKNPKIAEEIARLARIGGDTPPDAMMEQLRKFLASGKATPITHAWLAEAYILREDYSKAMLHLGNVIEREPDALHSHNNLAYAIALHSPERIDEALAHAQTAVAGDPSVADFHDTLGYVLVKMERLKEAVVSYETAIELDPQRADFHRRLAEAYTGLGEQTIADAHLRVAQELEARAAEAS